MDTRPSLGPGLEILLAREGGALGELPRAGRVLGRRAGGGVATLLPSLLGAQPTLSFCSCLWLFLHCPPRPPPHPGAWEQLTRELGEALLIWARTRASPQAVARTQRTGKSRGRMGRTPFTWKRASPAEAPRVAGGGKKEGGQGCPLPSPGALPE